MSARERFLHGSHEAGEPLGDVPPQEALALLAYEYDRASIAPRPEVALTLEDLERMVPPRDREVVWGWA
jgi:hypothetical protein